MGEATRLHVLIAHMAEAEPKFLDRLQQIFTKHHTLGPDEHDDTGTAPYAEQFIEQVVRLKDKGRRSEGCYYAPAGYSSISLTMAQNRALLTTWRSTVGRAVNAHAPTAPVGVRSTRGLVSKQRPDVRQSSRAGVV